MLKQKKGRLRLEENYLMTNIYIKKDIAMKKLFIALCMLIAMVFTTSCATDTVVVYRDYPNTVYYRPYYYWNGYHYTYHYPIPHHHTYKPNPPHHYNPVPPEPHGNNHQPYIPPKPTNVPKATVRPNNSHTSGSMSGRSGRTNNSGRR